ncbi:MAG: hypothetical protein Q9226_008254, partial [Calogaya cf. arnoldii]
MPGDVRRAMEEEACRVKRVKKAKEKRDQEKREQERAKAEEELSMKEQEAFKRSIYKTCGAMATS